MADPIRTGICEAHSAERLKEEVFGRYIRDTLAPQPEEVHRLVHELVERQMELEEQNRKLREMHQSLEAYRDRYIDLYDFAPLGYVTLDEDGYVQEINLAGANLLCVERDKLTGYSFGNYVANEDVAAFLNHVRECVSEFREVTSEFRLVENDGKIISAQLHSMPVVGPKEDVLCKTAITDITQRKKMEDALASERNLLRILIDNIPDYIYVKDVQSRFLVANSAVAHIMGAASPDELLGKTDFDFYPQELAAEYRADEMKLLSSGEQLINKDEPHTDPNGNPRTVMTTKVPLKDGRGNVIGLVGVSRDITERKQAEEKALAAQQRLMKLEGEMEITKTKPPGYDDAHAERPG